MRAPESAPAPPTYLPIETANPHTHTKNKQKLLERGSDAHRAVLLSAMAGAVLPLSLHTFGCRVGAPSLSPALSS